MEFSTSEDNAGQPNGTTHSILMNASDTCSAMKKNLEFNVLIYLSVSVRFPLFLCQFRPLFRLVAPKHIRVPANGLTALTDGFEVEVGSSKVAVE